VEVKMKQSLSLIALVFGVILGAPALAATRTVTLSVPGMNCAACPITVKKALGKVPGVAKTDVNLDKREATVTFDDARTNVDALMRATRDAGYPAAVVGSAK
jgi:mercuric ion binding protein